MKGIGSTVKMHQAKINLGVCLEGIVLKDNIYHYKFTELDNFLYSEGLEGQGKLIDIYIENLSP